MELTEAQKERADKLVNDHWEYVESILTIFHEWDENFIKHIELHYRTAMLHGYKHGIEDSRVS